MKYCIRGTASVWGGHQIELRLEMMEWLASHCQERFHIAAYDEAKFRNRGDAEAFARQWFEPGKWCLHEMAGQCTKSCQHVIKRICAPDHAAFMAAISSARTPESRQALQ